MTVDLERDAAPELALVDRVAASISSPGPTLTATQRADIAHVARAAFRGGAEPDGREPALHRFAATVAAAAHTIRPALLEEMRTAGLDDAALVETLGIVARLAAIDTFAFSLDVDTARIEPTLDTEATRDIAGNAALDGGWLPTVGPASPPNALSMLPSEHHSMHDIHGVLYLSIPAMGDLDASRGLHRTQMELVAARTSLLNDCFF